jgi:hypothetical protein
MSKRLRLPAFLVCLFMSLFVTGRTADDMRRLVIPQTFVTEIPPEYQQILAQYLDKLQNEYRLPPEATPMVQCWDVSDHLPTRHGTIRLAVR